MEYIDLSICGHRELAFFKGMAKGPIHQFIEDEDIIHT